jgi:hypothetical protein
LALAIDAEKSVEGVAMARARSRARSCRDATIKAPQTGNCRHAQAAGLPLFQWRKRLRNGGLMVETAPKRE